MNIKYLNESFKRLYEEAIDQEPVQSSIQSELRTQLEDALMTLQFKGATNIKEYEVAFQQAIENVFPDKAWWEVTDCNIFFSLFETRSPELTIEQIIAELKPEYKETVEENLDTDVDVNLDESLTESFVIKSEEGNKPYYIRQDLDLDNLPYDEPYDWFTNDIKNAMIFNSHNDAINFWDNFELGVNVFALDDNGVQIDANDYIFELNNKSLTESSERKIAQIPRWAYDKFYTDPQGMFGEPDRYSVGEIMEIWNDNCDSDPSMQEFDSFDAWWNETKKFMNSEENLFKESLTECLNKLNESKKIGQIPMWAYNIWYRDVQGSVTGDIASILSMGELMELWNKECDSDPSMQEFGSWDEWWAATQKFMERSKARHGATMDPRYDAIFREKLEECLKRLNEAQISDEDQRDSDLIRSMMAKIERRSNARFTPEEQAVLDKYGIKRNPYQKDLEVAGRPLESPVDSKNYDNNYYGYNNGNHGKINYADRARKLPQRQSSQVYGDHAGTRYISGNDWINKHTGSKPALNPNKPNYRRRNDYKTTLQSAERDEMNTRMHQPIDDMQRALGDRRYHQREVDQSQSKYDQAAAAARKTYDDSMRRAQSYLDDAQPGGYHYDRVQRAQGEVDKLLKRKPKNESLLKEDWSRGVLIKISCDTNSVKEACDNNTIHIPAVTQDGFENCIGQTSLISEFNNARPRRIFSWLDIYEDICEFWYTIYDNDIRYEIPGGISTLNKIIKTQQLDDSINNLVSSLQRILNDAGIEINATDIRVVGTRGEFKVSE